MSSRFIHVVPNVRISFFFRLNNTLLCVYPVLFFHSSFEGHLSCFYLLVTVNNAAVNIAVNIFVQVTAYTQKSNCWRI